jgi:hypothetical protein
LEGAMMLRFRLVLLILLSLTFAGCGKSAPDRLIGKWQFDAAKEFGKIEKDFGASKILGAPGVKMVMTIKFDANHTGNFEIPFVSGPITWKVLEMQGEKLTIEITNPKEAKPSKVDITFIDNDHMEFKYPDFGGKSLGLERVKEK